LHDAGFEVSTSINQSKSEGIIVLARSQFSVAVVFSLFCARARTAWAVDLTLHEAFGQHSPKEVLRELFITFDLHKPEAIREKTCPSKEILEHPVELT